METAPFTKRRRVPLRDRSALHDWGRRENPPYLVWQLVNLWIEGLNHAP
jgi:hypothetical protein